MKVKIHTIMSFKEIMGARDVEMDVSQKATVGELLAAMVERWGEALSSRLFYPESDRVLSSVVLMVNGRSIQFMNGLDTVLFEGDEVLLLPPAAGG